MTTFDPDQIVACPHCQALARHKVLASGNTFGALTWTDGRQIAPMLPELPGIVKCHACSELYWLKNATKIGDVDSLTGPIPNFKGDWKKAPMIAEPEEADYYRALENGFVENAEQERAVRMLAWWKRNDQFRDIDSEDFEAPPTQARPMPFTLSADGRKNLEALFPLLTKDNNNDRIMRAEILRQLGEFDFAKLTLDQVTDPELAGVVAQIRKLCDNHEIDLQVLWFG